MNVTCLTGSGCGMPLTEGCLLRRTRLAISYQRAAPNRRRSMAVVAGFGDQLLDYIEGGPKLRKWYGQGERPTDGGGMRRGTDPGPEQGEDPNLPRDAVLVTDADSPTGEFIVMQLILARAKIRVLVKNAQAASTAFGSYVTPIAGDVGSQAAVTAALRGARAVIVAGKLGPHILHAARASGVEHLVLPSTAGSQQGAFGFLGPDAALSDAKREAAVAESGIPHTIVRVGRVRDAPGGGSQLRFGALSGGSGGADAGGEISREDLALVLAGTLECPPAASLAFTVASDGPGEPPGDWQETLGSLQQPA